ncbi:MAG TPA: methyltransferase domain-containing protein [Miltoncostaeaceae bacterium]|nr:methyltransferase domain-containing protein [Miltoncostaeaceae bacterium]
MDTAASVPTPSTAARDPFGLDEMRAQIAAGTKLTGQFALRFLRAVHSEDPLATEESLASLPGVRGVHLYDSLVSWAPVQAGERVLDIGCGSGGATRSAARAVGPDGNVLGVDLNEACLDAARERTPDDLRVRYRRGDARALTFVEDRSQDCVIASMMLDELEDIRPVLDEVFRVLRPGGRFVASVAAFDSWRPMDVAFMGAVLSVVGERAPGALAGRAVRAGIPLDIPDRRAFAASGLATVEQQDVQLAGMFENEEDAWRLFSRSRVAKVLDAEGQEQLRAKLRRRTPHNLYVPIRFMRTRRPG